MVSDILVPLIFVDTFPFGKVGDSEAGLSSGLVMFSDGPEEEGEGDGKGAVAEVEEFRAVNSPSM